MATPHFHLLILETLPHFTFLSHSTLNQSTNHFWLHHQNTSRLWPLFINSTATMLVQATIVLLLVYWSSPLCLILNPTATVILVKINTSPENCLIYLLLWLGRPKPCSFLLPLWHYHKALLPEILFSFTSVRNPLKCCLPNEAFSVQVLAEYRWWHNWNRQA
jgi:hypothetical protein